MVMVALVAGLGPLFVLVIWVLRLTVNEFAFTALNPTLVAPVKLLPVITTDVPTGPLAGEKLLIVGMLLIILKMPVELVINWPSGFVTVIARAPGVASFAIVRLSVIVVEFVNVTLLTVAPPPFPVAEIGLGKPDPGS